LVLKVFRILKLKDPFFGEFLPRFPVVILFLIGDLDFYFVIVLQRLNDTSFIIYS